MVERRRRFFSVLIVAVAIAAAAVFSSLHGNTSNPPAQTQAPSSSTTTSPAINKLETLAIKGRAPKTGYSRELFGGAWADLGTCTMRDFILKRDMTGVVTKSATNCTVESGTLDDPYTGKTIHFTRGASTSSAVEIDHVVAIGDAWQKGAQQLSDDTRRQLYNDPLELLAVDGPANVQKSDGDAATWLPPNKAYRCRYVARQIAIKAKYSLWVTQAEHDAMQNILKSCPGQALPTEN